MGQKQKKSSKKVAKQNTSKPQLKLTQAELKRIIESAVRKTADRTTLVFLLAMVDEIKFKNPADRIVGVWNRANRYAEMVEEHVVNIKEVKEIIENNTGVKLNGW